MQYGQSSVSCCIKIGARIVIRNWKPVKRKCANPYFILQPGTFITDIASDGAGIIIVRKITDIERIREAGMKRVSVCIAVSTLTESTT